MKHLLIVAAASAVLLGAATPDWAQRRVMTEGTAEADPCRPAVTAGGLVYVSGVFGTDDNGDLAGPDVESQTRQALDRMREVLEQAGSSLAHTVSVSVFLKDPADYSAMNEVYASYFPDDPPVRTTVVSDLLLGARVQMAAVAVPVGATREVLHPSGWATPARPYSYIVRTEDLVFLAGLVSRRGRDDTPVPGSVTVQTRTILTNARTLLRAAGVGLDDVVMSRVFLTDEAQYDEMNNTYRTYFRTAPPARATAVAPLIGPDAALEITLVATRGTKTVVGPVVAPSLPLSTGIRAGDRLFLSGVLGNTDANVMDGAAQTREALTRIGRTLSDAGMGFENVVESRVYLSDLFRFAEMDEVYREWFPVEPPARTAVGLGLVSRNPLVEIGLTAVR